MNRKTLQRQAIRDVLQGSRGPLSAAELLGDAQQAVPGLGIATVYRNLRDMVARDELRTVELPGEPVRYEPADLDHHHHFECGGCGKVYDIPGCALDVDTELPDGFVVERHEVLLYGTCGDCAATPTKSPSA